jgi:hypothetical protein
VQGLGLCSSVVNEDRQDEVLDVFCESPADISPLVRVKLIMYVMKTRLCLGAGAVLRREIPS